MPLETCTNCWRQFESQLALERHITDYQNRASDILRELHQSRAFELLQELQQCVAHNTSKISTHDVLVRAENPEGSLRRRFKQNKSESKCFQCPHPECFGKKKTPFTRRKDLVRHFTMHSRCREHCEFCGCEILIVRSYVTHYDICEARLRQKKLGTISTEKVTKAVGGLLQFESGAAGRGISRNSSARDRQAEKTPDILAVTSSLNSPSARPAGGGVFDADKGSGTMVGLGHTDHFTPAFSLLPFESSINAISSTDVAGNCGAWALGNRPANLAESTIAMQAQTAMLARAPVVSTYTIDKPFNFDYYEPPAEPANGLGNFGGF
ncbi:hypothetical protein XA68_18262 [Ophiocordyceps unilateralis]|uniref:Uncharacterized protein n=1 Tax=Ophiocordyceps unilateralis TaxID=268505 RepID=A0A2A9P2A6_OPHUN|nr:hypothetical protein XA68_18262 [Ophiocordyceps unilateralis]